jgi:3-isopropylmalate/(R)-2-methylmalate dehydratase small subunit
MILANVQGRGIPLRGDDVDTDRIMPARFLRAVSWEGLERHLFEDDRAARADHPFNDPRYEGASILVVNRNFGCGSSREHAPQGLARAGIRAIVGESFAEIFQGNALMLGIPCLSAGAESIERLQAVVEQTPNQLIEIHIDTGALTAGSFTCATALPAASRDALLSGRWNPTAMLLDHFEEVRAVAARLPYLNGF